MGFLDNTSITVDAILTKKGRELLARGQNEFKITKFALADDEVDYSLYDTSHPNGSNFYAAVIENMPLLEAFVDENQLMRYKLITLPKETNKLPKISVGSESLTLSNVGDLSTITPNTTNSPDSAYVFTLQNTDVARITLVGSGATASGAGASAPSPIAQELDELPFGKGATTTITLNEGAKKSSDTLTGKSINIIAKSITSDTTTNVVVQGVDSGATIVIPVTVKKDPST